MKTHHVAILLAVAFLLPLVACGKTIGETLGDATITTHVKTALLNDASVGTAQIDVSTSAGIVTLSGEVRSKADAERAVQLARGVAGVKDVKSQLKVRGGMGSRLVPGSSVHGAVLGSWFLVLGASSWFFVRVVGRGSLVLDGWRLAPVIAPLEPHQEPRTKDRTKN